MTTVQHTTSLAPRRNLADDLAFAAEDNNVQRSGQVGLPNGDAPGDTTRAAATRPTEPIVYEDQEVGKLVKKHWWRPKNIETVEEVTAAMLKDTCYIRREVCENLCSEEGCQCEFFNCDCGSIFGCECPVAVYLHPEESDDENTQYIEGHVELRLFASIMSSPAMEILALAMKKHPRRAVKVPRYFQHSYLENNPILRIRPAINSVLFFEGQDRHNREHPLTAAWIMNADAVGAPAGTKLCEKDKKEIFKRQTDGNYQYHPLSTGSKSGKESIVGTEYSLLFAEPLQENTHVQGVGSFDCIPCAAANLFDSMSKEVLHLSLGRCLANFVMDHAGKGLSDKKWRQILQCALADWGYDLSAVEPSKFSIDMPAQNSDKGYLVRLKAQTAYPHCVSFYGDLLFDPAEKWNLVTTKDNLDQICGGKGCFMGVDWAFEIKQRGLSQEEREDLLHHARVGPGILRPLRANLFCSNNEGQSQHFLKLFASAAFEYGLRRVARILSKKANGNHKEITWDSWVCNALSTVKTIDVRFTSKRKPTFEWLQQHSFGVAKFFHERDIYIGFCGDCMFVPGMPNGLRFDTENILWVGGGRFHGFERAGVVSVSSSTQET